MIKIVVDSTGYLSKNFVSENNIGVVPVSVFVDGKDFKETEDISVKEFYDCLVKSKEFPKTSQPSVQDFLNVYEPEIKKGNPIISIHISEKVSGTINTARIAAKQLKTNAIKIIDSRSTIFSIRYLAEHAARLIKEHLTFEDVCFSTEMLVPKLHNKFALSELKYLAASGRINKSEALIGNVLSIKPILSFTNGAIKMDSLSRGWKKAKESLEKFIETIYNTKGIRKLGIMYGLNVEEASELSNKIEQNLKVKPDLMEVGAAIGNYAGPIWLGIGIQSER
ncbi:MAG: DegV family protein [Caldisericaceae bacterium]